MDLVSVIVPTYKRDSSLVRALESLENQTYKNIEVVVVNDCVEETWKEYVENTIQKFIDNGILKIVFIQNQVNLGSAKTRNVGIENASGKYITFLDDDDVYLPGDAVERLFHEMSGNGGDVISPDVFHNADRPRKTEILMTLSGRIYARKRDSKWGYKVMLNGGYSYNKHPRLVMQSQTNAGPCLLCRKSDFLGIAFEDESWLDEMPYALGEDQVLFYKMHQAGLKVLTSFDSGIVHLDAGTSIVNEEKERVLAYCDCRFKMIFWRKFILRKTSGISRVWAILFMGYTITVNLLISLLKLRFDLFKQKFSGYKSGILFKL